MSAFLSTASAIVHFLQPADADMLRDLAFHWLRSGLVVSLGGLDLQHLELLRQSLIDTLCFCCSSVCFIRQLLGYLLRLGNLGIFRLRDHRNRLMGFLSSLCNCLSRVVLT